MTVEQSKGQISREEQALQNLNSKLPEGIRGLITDVKFGKRETKDEELIVSACSWHNSRQSLELLAESLPKGVLISHGMCPPCFDEQNAIFDGSKLVLKT